MTTEVRIQLLQVKEELDAFLFWLAPQKPRRILEIGAHHGGTALHFCDLAKELVISVDLPNGMSGGLPDDQCLARNAMIAGIYPQFRGVIGDSHDAVTLATVDNLIGLTPLDLLFIDGDHSYGGVTQDFAMYRPLVRRGGCVALHDINDTPMHREAGCHVAPFWNELQGDKREFNIHGPWGGIGVWMVPA